LSGDSTGVDCRSRLDRMAEIILSFLEQAVQILAIVRSTQTIDGCDFGTTFTGSAAARANTATVMCEAIITVRDKATHSVSGRAFSHWRGRRRRGRRRNAS
jgi:hypothetical protein